MTIATVTKDDGELAWAILTDLSDRAGVPEWLGEKWNPSAKLVAIGVAAVIARHRASQTGSAAGGEK